MDGTSTTIRHTWSGADDVAWTELGEGEPLLLGGWWMSHLVHDLEYPPIRHFVETLAGNRRVIRMDPPGTGLTRSPRGAIAVGRHVDALTAVLDAAGVDAATVLAGSSGAPVAIELAARFPERVDRMILSGAYLRGTDIAPEADRDALVDLVRRSWGVGGRVMSDVFFPAATPDEQHAYLRHQRASGSSEAAADALAEVYAINVSATAGAVRAPTLVMHRRGDRAIPLALGAGTAAAIPGAELRILDGSAHHPWHGDSRALLREALAFAGADPSELAAIRAPEERGAPRGEGPISDRERQVLVLVARGRTDAQIADELFLSVHTIHRHVANARQKLGVSSRAAAAAWVTAHPD
ncbi:alpha/beta fold hydrolase [Microbacterium sp. CFH 31415]|uniref:alpha/beta fold hydrolase n=1 Tax=Microbacterium sp. CFH 31415 TaxID=2921732 RepID=UPI001F12E9B0|nr:alpha/beta fold hydrolase [Microbacterium sp. CFH 31415]MCH6229417.1 alpha/beta fold hydrolase [Microbacterium sp. CFH 31415]